MLYCVWRCRNFRACSIADNSVLDVLYYSLPLSLGGSKAAIDEWVANNCGLFPMSGGLDKTTLLEIPRRQLEAINPQDGPGQDDLFILDDSGRMLVFHPLSVFLNPPITLQALPLLWTLKTRMKLFLSCEMALAGMLAKLAMR